MLETFVALMIFLGVLAFKFAYIVAILVVAGVVLDWLQSRLHPQVAV